MSDTVTIRPMRPGEEAEVCHLVRRVFDEFVAPDFGAEGIEEFYRFAAPEAVAERATSGHRVLVAEDRTGIVGMLEIMPPGHIAMLFVESRGRGLGRELVESGVRICKQLSPDLDRMTVNASRFAVPVYRRLGFEDSGPEQTKNGITFLPMVCRFDDER